MIFDRTIPGLEVKELSDEEALELLEELDRQRDVGNSRPQPLDTSFDDLRHVDL